jgi:hypothetical protein
MVLVLQNLGYFDLCYLITGFMVILFQKISSLSRNNYEYASLNLLSYATSALVDSSIEIIK